MVQPRRGARPEMSQGAGRCVRGCGGPGQMMSVGRQSSHRVRGARAVIVIFIFEARHRHTLPSHLKRQHSVRPRTISAWHPFFVQFLENGSDGPWRCIIL